MSIVDGDRRRGETGSHHCLDYFFGRLWLSVYFPWRLADLSTVYFLAAAGTFAAVGLITLIVLFAKLDIAFGLTVIWAAIWLAYTHIISLTQMSLGATFLYSSAA
ncbi:hypothetical protein L0F63_003737 [Massospora cicadina]|nr:hypothetical protein L0F63_003737 [Massospora cicadina]